ncbi:NAD(P)-binding protein [Desulfosporosinus sp. BG]|uniref:NAD(P)-binding protein n=1 Tax=Desulfosporosinus sp. BG TaxID=1633135 RepID=UPI000839F6D6|nr:NAD(P)-binding protein [Desulfosporosinus sp. BG]ODA40311.1 FAD dependent dehydrogenase [Desulfosporosinus sp. BG]
MNVAIMGAGLSGLACAITLEKYGVSPTIFEKRSRVGDRFVNGEVLMSIFNRPITDDYAYLSESHGIFLQPLANISKMDFFSENCQASVSGHLGFINSRGREDESFESQLSRQVKSEIIFNSIYTYEELLQDFTHIIMATGDAAYALKIQNFQAELTVTLKGATVEGNFDRYHAATWLDNNLAPKGYGFLLPYSEKEATLTIGYPDYPENQSLNVKPLWDRFYTKACKDLDQNLKITDQFEVNNYIMGLCEHPRLGNTFFTGNCFGAMMPAFGFGQFSSILTGVFAASDLCGKGKYEELVKPLRQSYQNSLVLRHAMEQLDNHKLDNLVTFLNNKLSNHLLTNQKLNPLKILSYILRPFFTKNNTIN